MRGKFHVKKNDVVVVTSGNHKGKRGKILQVLPAKNRVIIEGVNLIKKHARKFQSCVVAGDLTEIQPINPARYYLVFADTWFMDFLSADAVLQKL